jgi:hypothetical protein
LLPWDRMYGLPRLYWETILNRDSWVQLYITSDSFPLKKAIHNKGCITCRTWKAFTHTNPKSGQVLSRLSHGELYPNKINICLNQALSLKKWGSAQFPKGLPSDGIIWKASGGSNYSGSQ